MPSLYSSVICSKIEITCVKIQTEKTMNAIRNLIYIKGNHGDAFMNKIYYIYIQFVRYRFEEKNNLKTFPLIDTEFN